MSNANTIYQLEAMAAYEPDGFQDFTRYLKETANKYFPADDLTIARINTSAKTDIKTNAGSKIVAIYVKTASGATTTGYLQLFNTSSASVTLGTTPPEEAIKLSNAANVAKVIRFWPGNGSTEYSAALSLAVTVTSAVNTTAQNATNAPVILVAYA